VVKLLFPNVLSNRALFLTGVSFFVGIFSYSGLTIMVFSAAVDGLLLPAFDGLLLPALIFNFIADFLCLLLCKAMVVFDDSEEIFFIGISTGTFLAIGLTDAIVGFPESIFKLIPFFLLCLVLMCKAIMVVSDDSEEIKVATQAEQEEEERALNGAENGSSPYELLKPVFF
jgi:hypothetical protein